MNDTISRQAVLDALNNIEIPRNASWYQYYQQALTAVDKLPSAQPEIIHCGECTKMEVDSVFHDCWCGETGKKVWINHYCGYADRREERR